MSTEHAFLNLRKIRKRVNNCMDFIRPVIIASPISGEPVRPILKTYIRGNTEVVEAEYIDPCSGTFIRKGIVSVKDLSKPVDPT